MTTYWLDLPYERPPLNHNKRLNRWAKAKLVAQVRRDVAWIARGRAIPQAERITVQLHYAPGRGGRYDPMNFTATTKPAIDGLVDAGVVVDDDSAHVHEVAPEIHLPPEPGPRCWLIVSADEGAA
jgi:crossover junction endodeoxyribonuclease RusA